MPPDDSLEEYEKSFWTEIGESEPSVRRFVAAHRTKPADEWEDPREIVTRAVTAAFREGVNKYVRKALWHFLEHERKRRDLTQDSLAQKAGISQPTYAKINRGETSFDSILMVLRALAVDLRSVPSPSSSEQTAEGLLVALDFTQRTVLGREKGTLKPRREDVEWLLHLQACGPWTEAFVEPNEEKGDLVVRCLAAAISIRLGQSIKPRGFIEIASFWARWITAWEICSGAIWIEDRST